MVVIIPAYQPDEKMVRLVDELKQKTDFPIVIVDDGSDQDKQKFFESVEKKATVLHHEGNKGKGAAIKTALTYIYDHFKNEEGVVTIDADGQHLVKDIIRVVDTWRKQPEALVLGSRKFTGKVPFKSRAGNAITRFVFAISTGVKIYDTQTGLRAFGYDRIPEMINTEGDRYEYEINVLLYSTRRKTPIVEETIETVYIEDNASSHFNPIKDAWRIYKMIFLFVLSSISSAAVDWIAFILIKLILGLFGVTEQVAKWIAEGVARLISASFNFIVNKELVFEGKGKKCILRYILTAAFILALDSAFLFLLTDVLPLPSWLGKILSGILCYPISFILQRVFVFKEKKDS